MVYGLMSYGRMHLYRWGGSRLHDRSNLVTYSYDIPTLLIC
jgi:hypothetical protein